VDVSVEDPGVIRQLAQEFPVVGRDQRLRSLEHVFHEGPV
jgi:hypothetical protein